LTSLAGAEADAVVARLRELRIVPVATVSAERSAALGEILLRAGLPCLEVTFRNDDALDAIEEAAGVEGLLVGAGTILSAKQVEQAVAAGADFAVAPGSNDGVIKRCQELGLPFFPGVATPTEIEHARASGFHTVKFFPASALGGAGFLRAVSATYRDVGFIPTGGVSPANLREYLDLPCVVACGGSWIVNADDVQAGRFDAIEARIREAIRIAAA
jgi:2-dehydro-3-deoxyphosphogluconate aldolase/(4S)-4-hydroxy-2-oxoglutarate aldolase